MANTQTISRVELVVGNIVHFYGARFEIVSTRFVTEEQFGKLDGNGDTIVAVGKWLDGVIEPGYFGPSLDFTFQGNRLARVTIETPPAKLSPAAKRAIKNYGEAACREAYAMHERGYGASGVANEGPRELRTTNQADAAINAGRELAGK